MATFPDSYDTSQEKIICNLCHSNFLKKHLIRHEKSTKHREIVAQLHKSRGFARSGGETCGVSFPESYLNYHAQSTGHLERLRTGMH